MIIDPVQQRLLDFFMYIGLDMKVEIEQNCDSRTIHICLFNDFQKDENFFEIISERLKDSRFQKDCHRSNLEKIKQLEESILCLKKRIDDLVIYENYFKLAKDMRHNIN